MAVPNKKLRKIVAAYRNSDGFLVTHAHAMFANVETASREAAYALLSGLDALVQADSSLRVTDVLTMAVNSMPTSGRELAQWIERHDQAKRLAGAEEDTLYILR